MADASTATFRLRSTVNWPSAIPTFFSVGRGGTGGLGMIGMANDRITTWATLDPAAYTPTPEKPWQGIWVGDYSGHGCEFLLLTQPDSSSKTSYPISDKAKRAVRRWPRNTPEFHEVMGQPLPRGEDELDGRYDDDDGDDDSYATQNHTRRENEEEDRDEYPYRGSIHAIKLTGDPHVPRGEYTFLAPSLGASSTIEYAKDDVFYDPRSSLPDHVDAVKRAQE